MVGPAVAAWPVFSSNSGKEKLLLEADVASQAKGEGRVHRGRFGEVALGPRLESRSFEGVEAIVIPRQGFIDRAQFAPLGLPPRNLEGPRFRPLAHRRPLELAFALGLEMGEEPGRSRIEGEDDVFARLKRVEGGKGHRLPRPGRFRRAGPGKRFDGRMGHEGSLHDRLCGIATLAPHDDGHADFQRKGSHLPPT
jgi:hypothetical protein